MKDTYFIDGFIRAIFETRLDEDGETVVDVLVEVTLDGRVGVFYQDTVYVKSEASLSQNIDECVALLLDKSKRKVFDTAVVYDGKIMHRFLIGTYDDDKRQTLTMGVYAINYVEAAAQVMQYVDARSKWQYTSELITDTDKVYNSKITDPRYCFKKSEGVKTCTKCERPMLIECFGYADKDQTKYQARCKDCVREDRRQYRKKQGPEYLELQKQKRARDRIKTLLTAIKSKSKTKKIPFNLTPDDIKIPEICPVLGVKLEWDGPLDNRPSLDKLRPDLGYVKGNVNIISFRANRIKSNGYLQELEAIAKWMSKAA